MGNCTNNTSTTDEATNEAPSPSTPLVTQPISPPPEPPHATLSAADGDQLEVPEGLRELLPAHNANTNVRHRFKWHEEIGRGVTGSVHSVTYEERLCALKKVTRRSEWEESVFLSEVQALSQLQGHRGVIGLCAVFLDEDFFYLVLERADYDLRRLMDGGVQSLRRLITDSGPCDEAKVKLITYRLFEAVAHLHSHDVVHRDLKPQNIVFCAADPLRPKLIDFGDAEMVRSDQTYPDMVGTPQYMAPEKLCDPKGWQLKAGDVWAVAAIAYEMFTGEQCFGANTQREVFAKVMGGQWSWPQSRTPSEAMQDVIAQCLCLDATERPKADEMAGHRWFGDLQRRPSSAASPLNAEGGALGGALLDVLAKVWVERLSGAQRDALRQQFEGSADDLSFDRFLEQRVKRDLAADCESVFREIVAAAATTTTVPRTVPPPSNKMSDDVMATLVGFDSDAESDGGSPSLEVEAESLSVSALAEFVSARCPTPPTPETLDAVFARFGRTEGLLTAKEFAEAMAAGTTTTDVLDDSK